MSHNNHHTRPEDLEPCGTTAAYRRHLRHGNPPCDDCKAANAEASRNYKERNYIRVRDIGRRRQRDRSRILRPTRRFSRSTDQEIDPLDLALLHDEVMEARA